MSDFEFPMFGQFDLTNFDIDLDIDENVFDMLTGASKCAENKSLKRKVSKRKKTSTKRKKMETIDTCDVVAEIPVPVVEEPSLLMRLLCSPLLCSFPRMESIETFSDDLLYCFNSSDFSALHYLFSVRMDPSCEVSLSYTKQKLSCSKFVAYCELIDNVHPDRILVAQKHEIEGNKISCETIVSFTDCLPVYNAIAGTVKDPELLPFFPASRAEILKRRMMVSYRPQPVQEQFHSLLESDDDLVIYGILKFDLVTDPVTQKGVSLHIDADFHSVHAVEKNCY